LDTPDLGHLKRIRKRDDVATLLLTTSTTVPTLPSGLNLPDPYTLPVPISAALTLKSLTLKSSLWPTLFTPPRKDDAENWSRAKCRWAWEAMKLTVKAAVEAKSRGEVGILVVLIYLVPDF
jgi:tRNA-specific adenosine deaminase 3